MKLAVVGSRKWTNKKLLYETLDEIPNIELIITGGAHGADTFALMYAREKNIPTKVFFPNYDLHGNSAPIRRNYSIAISCDSMLAFWDGKSSGTQQVISVAKKLNRIVDIILDEVKHEEAKL